MQKWLLALLMYMAFGNNLFMLFMGLLMGAMVEE